MIFLVLCHPVGVVEEPFQVGALFILILAFISSGFLVLYRRTLWTYSNPHCPVLFPVADMNGPGLLLSAWSQPSIPQSLCSVLSNLCGLPPSLLLECGPLVIGRYYLSLIKAPLISLDHC